MGRRRTRVDITRLALAGPGGLLLAGCVAASSTPGASGAGVPTAAMTAAASATTSVSPQGSTPAGPLADWLTEPLTDVQTGATVRLADHLSSVVIVEGMATWCPPCLEQQHEAQLALQTLGPGAVFYVSIDVDPREPPATLRAYADRAGFDWPFFVASPAFLRAWADSYGSLILSPPTTPIVVVDRTGHGHLTEVGIKAASRLVQLARALGA